MPSAPRSRTLPGVGALVAAAGIALVGPALTGCSGDAGSAVPVVIQTPSAGPYQAVELEQPIAKPDVTLQDTSGAPFNLARDTEGQIVLVYAGYTHCPDVCPTTVADVAAALRTLTPQERAQISVVMFSTDPVRDTAERMRAFLDQFDTSFIGVIGEQDAELAAINAMGIDVQPPEVTADGDVLVEHGAQVLGFVPPTDQAELLWTSGTTASEFAADLKTLLDSSSS